jgi:membrane fusion protein (multidrug efflux system)
MADGSTRLSEPVARADYRVEAAPRRLTRRQLLRRILLPLGPLVVVVLPLALWLIGGRYVSTDNAYVRADKVSISADVAGPVIELAVRDNQHVAPGDLLFRIDDEPYRIAVDAAEAQLASVRDDISVLQATYRQRLAEIRQGEADTVWYQREFDRQRDLAQRNVASQSKLDEARHNLDAARQRILALRQEAEAALAKLGGNVDTPVEQQADYRRALADVDRTRRDLRRTRVVAPIAGTVTRVDALQVGSYLAPGQPAFALVAVDNAWVEANPKETDLTYVKPGDPATVTVDAYPGREWAGHVSSLSPGTGAEFAVLPAQNASGNWVKVVQRVPVRIELDPAPGAPVLRAGMSVEVEIDTGHRRSLGDLVRSLWRWVGG